MRTYPATRAHGWLTFTNGSIIGQAIPASFIIGNIATDTAIYVPAGSAAGYGKAVVAAHAVMSGSSGNISALAVNTVIGSSLYIRNLSAFTGGRDAYSIKFATAQDKQTALLHAQGILLSKTSGLHYPCAEDHSADAHRMTVAWRCRFVTYHLPALYHVAAIRLCGKNLLIDVFYIPRVQYARFK